MKRTLIVLVVGLLAVGCATLTPEQKLRDRVIGEYAYNLVGANTGSTYKYVLLDTGILEIWKIRPIEKTGKRGECTWTIANGELHVKRDDGDIEVFRIILHSDADKERTPSLWDRLIQIADIVDGKRIDRPKDKLSTYKRIK